MVGKENNNADVILISAGSSKISNVLDENMFVMQSRPQSRDKNPLNMSR